MKSVLIIGLGRFGRHMAKKFLEDGHEVMAIEKDEVRADDAVEDIEHIQIGDATEERFMSALGVRDFDLAVIAIGDHFQTVLEITVLLKDLGCKFVVARASTDVHKKLLLRNGADYVSYAEKEAAERLAITFGKDNVFDYIELTEEVGIFEVEVPKRWIGKSLIDLDIRNKYGVSVLAFKKDGAIQPLPRGTDRFEDNQRVMVMGSREAVELLPEK